MMFRPRESHDLRLVQHEARHPPAARPVCAGCTTSSTTRSRSRHSTATTLELRFDSTVTLEHLETALPDYALEIDAQAYPFRYSDEDAPDLVRALTRHYPGDEVEPMGRAFLSPAGSTDTMALLEAMTLGIRNEFTYVRRPEKGVQRPEDTLRLRSGSCRDFAVFMMEAVRSLGFAARFVSGYIFVPERPPGAAVGGGATHAWMQVYLPGAGWVDFDPTNSIVGNRNLIRVAVAWDHGQALPLWGTFIGAASSFLGMEVEVSVTEPTPPR